MFVLKVFLFLDNLKTIWYNTKFQIKKLDLIVRFSPKSHKCTRKEITLKQYKSNFKKFVLQDRRGLVVNLYCFSLNHFHHLIQSSLNRMITVIDYLSTYLTTIQTHQSQLNLDTINHMSSSICFGT